MSSDSTAPHEPFPVGKIVAVVLIPCTFFGFIGFMVWPRGDKLGTIDLGAKAGSLAVDANRGAELNFRLDVEPGGRSVEKRLRSSSIAVELEQGGKTTTTSCKAYDGKVMSSGSWGMTGVVLECRLPVKESGKGTVRANATWASGFTPTQAVLEVRRSDP